MMRVTNDRQTYPYCECDAAFILICVPVGHTNNKDVVKLVNTINLWQQLVHNSVVYTCNTEISILWSTWMWMRWRRKSNLTISFLKSKVDKKNWKFMSFPVKKNYNSKPKNIPIKCQRKNFRNLVNKDLNNSF